MDLRAIADAFTSAFNAQELSALVALLAEDATAQVIGAPFPVEVGREKISQTSLPYIIDFEAGAQKAAAQEVEGQPMIICRLIPSGEVDLVIRLESREGKITKIEYFTQPNAPAELRSIVGALS